MNYRKLMGKIVECYGVQSDCASDLGISRAYLNQILNGKRELSYTLMCKLVEVLHLTEREALDIFFPNLVDKSKQ